MNCLCIVLVKCLVFSSIDVYFVMIRVEEDFASIDEAKSFHFALYLVKVCRASKG